MFVQATEKSRMNRWWAANPAAVPSYIDISKELTPTDTISNTYTCSEGTYLVAVHGVSVEHCEHILGSQVESDRVRVDNGLVGLLVDDSQDRAHQ